MKLRTKESISRFGGNPAGQAESGRMSSYRGLLSASQSLTLYIPITVRITAPSCRPGRVQSSECLPGLHACRLRPAGATRNRFPLGTYSTTALQLGLAYMYESTTQRTGRFDSQLAAGGCGGAAAGGGCCPPWSALPHSPRPPTRNTRNSDQGQAPSLSPAPPHSMSEDNVSDMIEEGVPEGCSSPSPVLSTALSLPTTRVKSQAGGCASCGVPFLCTLQPTGEWQCTVCASGIHEGDDGEVHARPAAKCTPAASTDDAVHLWRFLQQEYLDKDKFIEGVTSAAATFGNRRVKRCSTSNSKYVYVRCVNPSCKFVVKAGKGKKSGGVWALLARKHQIWDHIDGCSSSVSVWPSCRMLAANPQVRAAILAQQSQKSMEKDMGTAAFVRIVEAAGFTFPQRADDETERCRKNRLSHLMKRVRDKVLGHDPAGMQINLTALVPFVEAFNKASDVDVVVAKIHYTDDGYFDGVTVMFVEACKLVSRLGLPVFSMDGAHFIHLRSDLKLLSLDGYFAENKVVTLLVSICFGETAENYNRMLALARPVSQFWQFFDSPKSTLFIDRGSALLKVVNDPAVLTHGRDMYRHCYIHIVRNCEDKKGWGQLPVTLLSNLAKAPDAKAERSLLQELKRAHEGVFLYVTSSEMDRRRWIGHYFQDKMDWNKTCSNAAESFNSVAKLIQAREVMPTKALEIFAVKAQSQLHDFINSVSLRISRDKVATQYCMNLYGNIAERSKQYVILSPELDAPWAMHIVSTRQLAGFSGTQTFQVCVHPKHISCSGPACITTRKMGLPCEHMICVAHQEFRKLDRYQYFGCKFMAENFDYWLHNSGLFYENYLYSSADFHSFTRKDQPAVRVPVPNIDECVLEAQTRPPLRIRGIVDFKKQTKRYRSKGEAGPSTAVRAPRPVAADNSAVAAQQRLLCDKHLIGKFLMLVYESPLSKSAFKDRKKTPANGLPRPVRVTRLPYPVANNGNRFSFDVTCLLTDIQTDGQRKGVRSLQLRRVKEYFEVQSITAAMKRNEWIPPRVRRLRRRVASQDLDASTQLRTNTTVDATTATVSAAASVPKKVGVTWIKESKKWRARVDHLGTRYNLGFHTRWEDAAKAVDDQRQVLGLTRGS
jgi:hypothetical protein